MDTSELLQRLSGTLRSEIGPAVDDEFTRTQAYMASVILAKVSKQVALSPTHLAAERDDLAELQAGLRPMLADAPTDFVEAVEEAANSSTVSALGPVIEAIYRWGTDQPVAAEALALVRVTLRNDIDRRMEIAT